jgi:N-terminal acetyltransferase B complex non-catalytic subunit
LADGCDLQLTSYERQFFEFASAIAEWLEPFHNHIRPSPATVLADAMKQNELKTGKPLRGIELPAENDSTEQKEPPQVMPPPEIVTAFFDGTKRPIRINSRVA